jgi:hypothetical protein
MEKNKNYNNALKEAAKFVYIQFTDLGAAFLPTARGADLPLPTRDKTKEETAKTK